MGAEFEVWCMCLPTHICTVLFYVIKLIVLNYTIDGMSINTWFLNGKTNVMKLFSSDWRSACLQWKL